MNIGKLRKEFNNTQSSDKLGSFVQTIRINEELSKMNEEITFPKFKKFLDEIFKDNKDYEIFNKEEGLKNRMSLINVNTKNANQYNKQAYSYYNKKKNILFVSLPSSKQTKSLYNVLFYIYYKGEALDINRISFANQLQDLKDLIEFNIVSVDGKPDYKCDTKFEDLELDVSWFPYTNLKILTEDCIKCGYCKDKKCPNSKKCKKFYPMIDYTKNMYNLNDKVNLFLGNLCKETKNRVDIKQDKKGISYIMNNLEFRFNFCTRKDEDKSTASFILKTKKEKEELINISGKDSKHGKEMQTMFTEFTKLFKKNKKAILAKM